MKNLYGGICRISFVALVAASLAACGGGGGSTGPGPTPPTKSPPTQSPPTQSPPTMTPPTTAPTMTPPPASMAPGATPTPTAVPTSAPPAFAAPPPPGAGKTNVIFQFGIPHSSRDTYGHARPYYVSFATKSMSIVTDRNTGSPAVFNLAPGPLCTDTATTLYCQVYEAIATGNGQHDFIATLYGNANAAAPALSVGDTGTVTVTGTSGTPLLLKAIVANIALSLGNTNPPIGSPVKDLLHIVLTDAAGGLIASDSTYNPTDLLYNPVTLTSSDTVNGPLSHYGVNYQSDVFYVTANYNGVGVTPIMYSATAQGVNPSNVQNATLTP